MTAKRTYAVDVCRDGNFWMITVPEVERSTQARTLAELDAMARDLVAVMADLDPQAFELDISVKVPDAAITHIAESQRLRSVSAEANSQAAEEFRAAVRVMVLEAGFTVRDVGRLLKISHQRVHQLVHEDPVPAKPAPSEGPERPVALVGG